MVIGGTLSRDMGLSTTPPILVFNEGKGIQIVLLAAGD